MPEIIDKPCNNNPNKRDYANYDKDPIITDLNMTIAMMKMEGLTKTQIANKLDITLPDVIYHLNRVKTLTELSNKGEIDDPINNHRARLQRNFKRIEQVYKHVFKPGSKSVKRDASGKVLVDDHVPGWKNDIERLKLATSTGLTLDKGLGVLVDKTENLHSVDALTQHRQDMQARIDAARQFGLSPDQEIKPVDAEVIEDDNKAEISSK